MNGHEPETYYYQGRKVRVLHWLIGSLAKIDDGGLEKIVGLESLKKPCPHCGKAPHCGDVVL